MIKRLDQIQRLGCKAILGAFRTVSVAILEAEAGVDPTYIRLHKRLLRHFSKLYTLPKDHPQASELPYQAVKIFTDGSRCYSLHGLGAVHVHGSMDEIHWADVVTNPILFSSNLGLRVVPYEDIKLKRKRREKKA